MHYSRIMPAVNGQRYFTSTAVFLNEVMKFGICLTMALYELSKSMPPSTPASALFAAIAKTMFTGDSWKLAIPAMLYTLQNSLQYVAVSNLDAATFQVTYQLKILTTALFSVVMLRRSLRLRKWVSLVLLMLGIAVVQIPTNGEQSADQPLHVEHAKGLFWPRSLEELRDMGSAAAAQLISRSTKIVADISKRSATYEGIKEDFAMQQPQMNASVGLAAVLLACVLSGLAGVYFEKVLKDSTATASVWIRNVQLSFYSLFPALFLGVIFKDGEEIAKTGFFAGYNWVVWAAIVCQATGGVIVALVVNYADNIAKNFATSISIVISFLASVYFFDMAITANVSMPDIAPFKFDSNSLSQYLIGTTIVLYATYLYSSQDRSRAPSIRIADYEKTTIAGDPSYFNDESTPVLSKGSLKAEALSTSRPGTPTVERHNFRLASEWKQSAKRDD